MVRETEVDNKKKPDIRLLHLNLPPISIEVKWAHKWSINKMEGSLLNQLVGQYLKAAGSTHGVFLLVNAKQDRTWRIEKENLNFKDLLDHLRNKARKLESNEAGVARLEVIGIDLKQEGKQS